MMGGSGVLQQGLNLTGINLQGTPKGRKVTGPSFQRGIRSLSRQAMATLWCPLHSCSFFSGDGHSCADLSSYSSFCFRQLTQQKLALLDARVASLEQQLMKQQFGASMEALNALEMQVGSLFGGAFQV